MNVLYLYAHPEPHSFNALLKEHALTLFATCKINVQVSDLYAMSFQAVATFNDFNLPTYEKPRQYFSAQKLAFEKQQLAPDIDMELKKIAWADHLIFHFPFWWFSMPAILKGWLDRTMVKGFAYDTGRMFDTGLLQGKTASFSITTQSKAEAYTTAGAHGQTIEALLLPLYQTLRLVGLEIQSPFIGYGAYDLTNQQVKQMIEDYQEYLLKLMDRIVA